MKVDIVLRAFVIEVDGIVQKIGFDNPKYYRQQLQQLKGQKYASVTIKSLRAIRSLDQNAYWHGVCYPILAELTGHTITKIKEVTKRMFLPTRVLTVNGKEYEVPMGTSDLSKAEGVDYTQSMFELAHDLGGHIPTPEEAGYESYNAPMKGQNYEPPKEIDYPMEELTPTF